MAILLVGAGVLDGPPLDVFRPKGMRTLRWAQYLSCAWQERYWRERTAFRMSEGFLCPISAHARSHPLALALRGLLSDTLYEAKRKTEAACSINCHSEPVRTPVRNLNVPGKDFSPV